MTYYINKKDIEHTKGDTFLGEVSPDDDTDFEEGTQMQFIVTEAEDTENIIDKTFSLNSDGIFEIILTASETAKLDIADYLYKIIQKSATGNIFTIKSGNFIVKWGE